MGQIVFQATLGGQVAVAGPNTASSFTLTLPAATDTLVGKATTDTLTNKTLTSPTITGATLTTSAFNGTVGATTASTGAFTTLSTSSTTTFSGLTASTALALDASKNVVSVTNTGTGNNVLSASPTLTGTIAGASLSLSSLTSGRVTYAGASGLLTDSATLTYDGTTLTATTGANFVTTSGNVNIGTTVNNVFDQVGGARPLLVQRSDTSTTLGGSTASITISNGATTTSNTAQLNFAAITGASTSQYSSAVISAIFGARTNGQYPTGELAFLTSSTLNAAPSEKMRITSAGNVGIGTSSPSQLLHVASTTNAQGLFATSGAGGGSNRSSIILQGPSNTWYINTNGSDLNGSDGALGFYGNSATRMVIDSSGNLGLGVTPNSVLAGYKFFQLGITGATFFGGGSSTGLAGGAYYSGGWLYNGGNYATRYDQSISSGQHQWYTAPSGTAGNAVSFTQAMTLDASGNLLVNTTATGGSNLSGFVSLVYSGGTSIDVGHNTSSSSGATYAVFRYDGTAIGTISQSGTTAVLYNVTSDQRLKENIVDAPSGNIDAIKVRSFDWIVDGSHQEYGMIAQELIEVAPYAVNKPENSDEMMAVDYSKLVPMMIKEIQDLKQRIKTLENK